MGRSLYCGFHGKEQARQGKQASDWLAGVISVESGAEALSLLVSLALGGEGR